MLQREELLKKLDKEMTHYEEEILPPKDDAIPTCIEEQAFLSPEVTNGNKHTDDHDQLADESSV